MAKFPLEEWAKKKKEVEKAEGWEEIEKPKKIKLIELNINWEKIFSKILIFAFIIFLGGVTAFLISLFLSSERVAGLRFEISGPERVSALKPTEYVFKIVNNSKKTLTNVSLEIFLSEAIFFQDEPQNKNLVVNIGTLLPQQSKILSYSLIFFGEENKVEVIEANLNYKVENKPQIFTETKKLSVSIVEKPVSIKTSLPKTILTRQNVEINFDIENKADVPYNFQIEIEKPVYFKVTNVDPPPFAEESLWYFENFKPNEKKNIKITGYFEKVPAVRALVYKTKFIWKDIEYTPPTKLINLDIKESPVVIDIKESPKEKNVNPGTQLSYFVSIKNNSSIPIQEPEIKATFAGPFDFEYLRTDGYFSLIEESIIWNARNRPELQSLDPNEEVKLQFDVRLLDSYPIMGEKEKDFDIKVFIELSTKSVPPEIKIADNVFRVSAGSLKKLNGRLEVNHSLVYKSDYFDNLGPMPLKPEQESFITWLIEVKTIGEDFENVTFETKLPLGVEFLNQVGGDAEIKNVSYDKVTGNFVYRIDKIKANIGYLYRGLKLAFLLKVKPPAGTDRFIVINDLNVKAKGSFSENEIAYKVSQIYASEIK
jgi:hypothetical protein